MKLSESFAILLRPIQESAQVKEANPRVDAALEAAKDYAASPAGLVGGFNGAMWAGEGNRLGGIPAGILGAYGVSRLGEHFAKSPSSSPNVSALGDFVRGTASITGGIAGGKLYAAAKGRLLDKMQEPDYGDFGKEGAARAKEQALPEGTATGSAVMNNVKGMAAASAAAGGLLAANKALYKNLPLRTDDPRSVELFEKLKSVSPVPVITGNYGSPASNSPSFEWTKLHKPNLQHTKDEWLWFNPTADAHVHLQDHVNDPAILAHEIGHSTARESTIGRLSELHAGIADKLSPSVLNPNLAILGGAAGALTDNKWVNRASVALPALLHAPRLLNEAQASIHGIRHLRDAGATGSDYVNAAGSMLPAFGTYATLAGIDVAKAYAGNSAGKALRNVWKAHKAAKDAEKTRLAAATKEAAVKREKRRPWNVANIRSGKRSMSVDTLLKKEKDGTLGVKLGEDKESASKLRSMFKLVPEHIGNSAMGTPVMRWTAHIGDDPVGVMRTSGNTVEWSSINEKMQGMGLGKKMYGEVMRRMPKQELASDSSVSDQAARVWQSMKNRAGYEVSTPVGGKPLFSLRLPGSDSKQRMALRSQFVGKLPDVASIPGQMPSPSAAERLRRAVDVRTADVRLLGSDILGAFGFKKKAQYFGSVLPYTEASDQGAARGKKNPDNIPSREGIAATEGTRREYGRDGLAVELAPGSTLSEIGATNLPQERTASVKLSSAAEAFFKIAGGSFKDYLLSPHAEHHTDLAGLGLMAGSSADKMRSQLKHPENAEKGSLVGGTAGRSGMDLTALGLMAAPTVAHLLNGEPSGLTGSELAAHNFKQRANALGLAALAVPTIDNLQAGIRARRAGVDPEQKMLLGHKAHAISELAGLGTLAAPVLRGGPSLSAASTLAGYGTLAAPVVEDLAQHDESKKVFRGARRSGAELAGLGLLAGGVLAPGSHDH